MYKPNDAIASDKTHEIIAIVGSPGSGKSTSTLTFPNRIYGDSDHKVPKGELAVPFYDATWTAKMGMKKYNPADPDNHRDAIKKWMRTELPKFVEDQSYIHDSWTECIRLFSRQIRVEEARLDKPNKFFFWGELKKHCEEISGYLKDAKCRVVTTFHETPEWIEGENTGKLKPVQDGSFKDQMFSIYTDVWRMVNGIRVITKDKGGMSKVEIIPGRFWQIAGDPSFDANANDQLSKLIRKHGIKYVQIWISKDGAVKGGYEEIQRIYREEALTVVNGILQPPTVNTAN